MKKLIAITIVLTAVVTWSARVEAQPAPTVITAAPAAAPVEAAPVVSSPLTWYGGLAGLLSFHGWGGANAEGGASSDFELGFGGGLYASSYYVLGDMLHFGGYVQLTFGSVEVQVCDVFACVTGSADYNQLGLGLSAKFGIPVGSIAWLGGAIDAGLHVSWDDNSLTDNAYGVELFPRFDAEFIFLDTGAFKLGGTAAIGPRIIPYETDDGDGWAWWVDITTLIGINFGY